MVPEKTKGTIIQGRRFNYQKILWAQAEKSQCPDEESVKCVLEKHKK
jgi:hypothetical protein